MAPHQDGLVGVFRPGVTVGSVMEFRMLGLLEVVDDGRPVTVGPGKESALLALLLLNANQRQTG